MTLAARQPAPSAATSTRRPAPPGPRGLPLLGSGLSALADPLGFVSRLARTYGDVAQFSLPGQRVYLLSHPDAIEELLLGQHAHLIKDAYTRDLSLVVGQGLLTSEGDFWRRQRRLAQPAFHARRVQTYGEVMVRLAEEAVARFHHGQTRDVHAEMMRLTLAVVGETLFGVPVEHFAAEMGHALDVIAKRFAGLHTLIPMYVPSPANRRLKHALERLDQIVYGIIAERRRTGSTGDLISMLMDARTEDGSAMSDQQLRDEAITLLLAGHETTAIALSFALDLVSRHPEVDRELASEISTVLGEGPATVADLPKLRYADSVVREAMRLYPPAWAIGREAIAPCRIAGYDIAPGTQLWAAQWIVHRDPRWFDEPEQFRPERWLGDLAKRLPRFAYFPFGGGPRICIGNAFAMTEATLLLVTLLRRLRFVKVSAEPVAVRPSVTLRPQRGVPLMVVKRA